MLTCPSCPVVQLKLALEAILQQPGAVRPDKVRFFRGQMQTIISRALTDLGLTPVPTRRCFTLIGAAGKAAWDCLLAGRQAGRQAVLAVQFWGLVPLEAGLAPPAGWSNSAAAGSRQQAAGSRPHWPPPPRYPHPARCAACTLQCLPDLWHGPVRSQTHTLPPHM